MRSVAALLVLTLAPMEAAALSPLARRGRQVLREAQCNRCHAVSDAVGRGQGVAPAPRQLHCVGCHNWILDTRHDEAAKAIERRRYPDWDRYLDSILHFTGVPDLGMLTRRVDPRFVRAFLDAPFDLRPHMDESMMPVRLRPADKDALVAYLIELNRGEVAHVSPAPAPSPERIARGAEIFAAAACTTCHVFGNHAAAQDPSFLAAMKPVAQHAPNLRFVRERIPREQLVRFIRDPQSIDPKSRMPKPEISAEDVELVADFLLFGDAGATPAKPLARPVVPLLSRAVSYEEVSSQVLGRICVHCHMDPRNNDGEGGPGGTGGLGFAAVHLNLETYAGIRAGLVRNGKRVSVLDPGPQGEPPLLMEALLRRYDETAADARNPLRRPHTSEVPGMPMTLPPLAVEQLSLIKTWIVQGAPGLRSARAAGRSRERALTAR